MRKIFTAGSFDLFHFGHLELLRKAKEMGDYLIVAVSTDELIKGAKGLAPIIPFKERYELIKHCDYVDEVLTQTTLIDIEQFILSGAETFVIGDDWISRTDNDGLNWLRDRDLVAFVEYTQHLSSSEIKKRIIQNAYAIIEQQVRKEK